MDEPTHASFFSGVGGLDLGLERAGWRTVSLSEIDPYAVAVLGERWPAVPQLGDIRALADAAGRAGADRGRGPGGHGPANLDGSSGQRAGSRRRRAGRGRIDGTQPEPAGRGREFESGPDGAYDWRTADLWTGGFPCQDLSVAGKRAGFHTYELDPDDDPEHAPDIAEQVRTRSGLAFAFLDLAAVHRPPAIILENVPGLLSSNAGRDLGALLGALGELGYGWAYRVLDARYFGVPQRRRRVFIVAIAAGGRAGTERAAEVLSVGSRCEWHPPAGVKAGPGTAPGARGRADDAGILRQSVNAKWAKRSSGPAGDEYHNLTVGAVAPGAKGWRGMRGDGADPVVIGPVLGRPYDDRGHENGGLLVGPAADAARDGTADGLARRLDDRGRVEVVTALSGGLGSGGPDAAHAQAGWLIPSPAYAIGAESGQGSDLVARRTDTAPALTAAEFERDSDRGVRITSYAKHHRATDTEDAELWDEADVAPTLTEFDASAARATVAILGPADQSDQDARLLPNGLDSHRYRCCGNGVVSDVTYWIGRRLIELGGLNG